MANEIIDFSSEAESPSVAVVSPPAAGIATHVRVLRRRHRGISRWLALALLAGALVALAFVKFLAR